MNQDIATKKSIKMCVALFSTCFLFLNASVLKAQVTGAVAPDADSMDMTETTDTTTDTSSSQILSGVPDTIGETPDTSSSSGGGGGALAGLLLVGAVVAIASSKKKAPTIQKTLAYEKDVYGRKMFLLDMSRIPSSSLQQPSWQKLLPQVSMQLGSYTNEVQPYSFMNVRLKKVLSSNVALTGDIGSRMFQRSVDNFGAWQRLSMGISARNVFVEKDALSLIANYSQGDDSSRVDDLQIKGDQFYGHESVFLDKNTRFKLAYSKALVENQLLRFQLSKYDSETKTNAAQHYQVQLAWQLTF